MDRGVIAEPLVCGCIVGVGEYPVDIASVVGWDETGSQYPTVLLLRWYVQFAYPTSALTVVAR
jgi:hypothetical protein